MLFNFSDILMSKYIDVASTYGKEKIHKGTNNDLQNIHLKPKIE